MPFGIDVSRWQASIDWNALAESISFVYIKGSDGITSDYPSSDAQWAGAGRVGLKRGLYHYAQTGLDPVANAEAFLGALKNHGAASPGCLAPCVDIETTNGSDHNGWLKTFIVRLSQDYYGPVVIYTGAAYMEQFLTESWMGDRTYLWIAHYGVTPGHPRYLTPRVILHQYSSTGRLPGIVGNVDLDYALGSLDYITIGASTGAVPQTAPAAVLPVLEYGDSSPAVARLQTWLRRTYPLYAGDLPSTGNYRELTSVVVAEFQKRSKVRNVDGSVADGRRVGDLTNAALWAAGYRG